MAYRLVSITGTQVSGLLALCCARQAKNYRDPKSHLALVIYNRAAELRHKIQEWKREGRNHPMIEVYEEEIKALEKEGQTHAKTL